MERPENRATPPGLKYRRRKDGSLRAVWVARAEIAAEGFPIKTVNLTSLIDNPAALQQRCERLQTEMRAWYAGRKGFAPIFDGSFGTLLAVYETDPDSPFRKLKPSSARPYGVYLRKLKRTIAARRIDAVDGRDLNRWFDAWSQPDQPGGKPKLAAAGMAMNVIKSAISFGITCRFEGCVAFMAILDELEFRRPKPRKFAPTAGQVEALRRAAHADRRPLRALAYALQFETTARQYDVIGEWLPLADPRPSAVLGYGEKWIGPQWSQIDDKLILRLMPTKTEDTTEVELEFDLKVLPMVVAELAHIPMEQRRGPIVVNEFTGQPYRHNVWRDAWRADANACGIDKRIWNRDLRAGGITEGGQAGAAIDDRAKQAGHSNPQTTARVYDRTQLEAQRRVSKLRSKHRNDPRKT